jgi:hypothetical protein
MFPDRDKLFGRIQSYVRREIASDPAFRDKDIQEATVRHAAPIIEHAMIENGHVPEREEDIGDAIQKIFEGKRVFEQGCRGGNLLRFFQRHGAIVGGNTDARRVESTKKALGPKALVLRARAEEIGDSPEVKRFSPHYIISANIYDDLRKHDPDFKPGKALESLGKMVRNGAKAYVLPSTVRAKSLLEPEHYDALKDYAEIKHLTNHAEGQKKRKKFHTFSIRPRKNRFRR